jgi:hypothetical protein
LKMPRARSLSRDMGTVKPFAMKSQDIGDDPLRPGQHPLSALRMACSRHKAVRPYRPASLVHKDL